ncbi:hypothetical protein M0804_001656 [Polistes exclamans]|nr:hypothetical protein M0804_001656 [Polistes exclamans]
MEIRRPGEMSNPKNVVVGGQVREGTRVVLREITAMLHNSPPTQTSPRRKELKEVENEEVEKEEQDEESVGCGCSFWCKWGMTHAPFFVYYFVYSSLVAAA